MHANVAKLELSMPDVTWPGDVVDTDKRDEVVHHEEIPSWVKKRKKSKRR